MFTGNKYARWDKFLAGAPRPSAGHVADRAVLLVRLATSRPATSGTTRVAGAAYMLVFGLYFLAIVTGLMLRGVSAGVGSPLRWFASLAPLFGGSLDRPMDSSRRDVAAARLHRAPRLQRAC